MNETDFYDFHELVHYVDQAFEGEDLKPYRESWTVLHLAVIFWAMSNHGAVNPRTDEIRATSWAFEDFAIALVGRGAHTLTGALRDFWHSIPKELHPKIRTAFERGIGASERGTSDAVERRYAKRYRDGPVRTPADEPYHLQCILPTAGRRVRMAIEAMGEDYDAYRSLLNQLRTLENAGFIDISAVPVMDPALERERPALRLVKDD